MENNQIVGSEQDVNVAACQPIKERKHYYNSDGKHVFSVCLTINNDLVTEAYFDFDKVCSPEDHAANELYYHLRRNYSYKIWSFQARFTIEFNQLYDEFVLADTDDNSILIGENDGLYVIIENESKSIDVDTFSRIFLSLCETTTWMFMGKDRPYIEKE